MRTAWLALADGTVYRGHAFGATAEVSGEVVFNTSMSGYEEILTDPSYAGQLVTMTYPEIGTYGFNDLDAQANRAWAAGVIVRSACLQPSNFRATAGFDEWLRVRGLVGIAGIDTRALTRKLRMGGAQMGVVSTSPDATPEALVARAQAEPGMDGRELASVTSTQAAFDWTEGTPRVLPDDLPPAPVSGKRVVVIDYGVKKGILRQLVDAGASVRVVPWNTTASEVKALKPDGVVLSNGPGDPAAVPGSKELVTGLVGEVPVMGICLGHQILALGLGGRTYKLKFGHRGGNHPVLDKDTGRVEITAQNHGFAVDPESLGDKARVTHHSLFDGCCEGLELPNLRAFGVQYHPEAAPGPNDARHIFQRFARLMEQG